VRSSRTAYDHAKKIGNQGDTFKHAVLAHLLSRVAKEGSSFQYVETNAGRPLCVLPEKGEWTRGVGALSASRALAEDDRSDGGKFDALGAYRANCLTGAMQVGSVYPGSTEIAFRALRALGGPFEMRLWETHAATFDDLTRHFFPWAARQDARVIVEQADGYELLSGALDSGLVPTFVLVDPPDASRVTRLESLLSRLVELKVAFLCWTPKGGNSSVPATRPAPHFPSLLAAGGCGALFARWTIGWAPFCQLTLPVDLVDEAHRVARAVCQAMNERNEQMSPTWSAERVAAANETTG
jgi:hypothetical protein